MLNSKGVILQIRCYKAVTQDSRCWAPGRPGPVTLDQWHWSQWLMLTVTATPLHPHEHVCDGVPVAATHLSGTYRPTTAKWQSGVPMIRPPQSLCAAVLRVWVGRAAAAELPPVTTRMTTVAIVCCWRPPVKIRARHSNRHVLSSHSLIQTGQSRPLEF